MTHPARRRIAAANAILDHYRHNPHTPPEGPTAMTTPTSPHLAPDACYVCGGSKHATAAGGHDYWSNADAAAEFAAADRRLSRPGYVEARYVAQHRPY